MCLRKSSKRDSYIIWYELKYGKKLKFKNINMKKCYKKNQKFLEDNNHVLKLRFVVVLWFLEDNRKSLILKI